MQSNTFLRANVAGIVCGIVIMILCGIPGNDLPDLTFLEWLRPDKMVHLFMFGTLNFLLIRGFKKQDSYLRVQRSARIYATVTAILYGILTEVLQATIFIHRSADVRDAAADALGALCGIWIYNYI